jgi:hypothetical protein
MHQEKSGNPACQHLIGVLVEVVRLEEGFVADGAAHDVGRDLRVVDLHHDFGRLQLDLGPIL